MQAARRLANDPRTRAKAAEVAKPVAAAVARETGKIARADDPARQAGRLVGRLKRRYLDGED